ncbi:MAG TPA: 50S ribosomal protein L31e [Candidatus Korarchaeota archaeon]|nr:50S ribosomal protein L31e [Candidatus Korarchaeota archaeon]
MAEVQEVTFNINMGILIRVKYPPKKRAARAVKFIKAFVRRHAKVPEDYEIKVRPELNELLWSRGAGNPPGKVRVRVVLDEEEKVATIWPA